MRPILLSLKPYQRLTLGLLAGAAGCRLSDLTVLPRIFVSAFIVHSGLIGRRS